MSFVGPGDDGATDVGHVLREGFGGVGDAGDGYVGFVSGEGGEVYFGPDMALKAVEVFECKGAGDLPGSVAAEVEEYDAVPIFYGGFSCAVGDGDGFDKFVGFTLVIGVLYGCDGVGFCDAFALCEQVVGDLGAFPTVVAVHGVIAPGYGGDAANAIGFEHGEEFAHAVDGALRRCVASVCEGVEEEAVWGEAALGCHFDEALVVSGP